MTTGSNRVANGAAAEELPRPDKYVDAMQACQYYTWRPDAIPGWLANVDMLRTRPTDAAAIWWANVDWAHVRGTTGELATDLEKILFSTAGSSFLRYARAAADSVASGRPAIDQLRFVADASNPDYSRPPIVDGSHRVLRAYIFRLPEFRGYFGEHRVYDSAKQKYVERSKELPDERTGLVELMVEAELWARQPVNLPPEILRLHHSRLLGRAKRAEINVKHLASASHGLPARTRSILLQAAAEHRQQAPPVRARLMGQGTLANLRAKGWR